MKKQILTVFATLISVVVFSQRPTATIQQVNDFINNSTLYVVMDESPINDYNAEIRKAVEKSWTLNTFKFIRRTEVEEKLTDSRNAFLIPVVVQFPSDKDTASYLFLSVLIGGAYETVNDLPEICTFPLCYDGDDEGVMTYKLPAIVAFFNRHIQNIQNNPKLLKDKKFATYTKQKKSIADKTLYLIKEEQSPAFDESSEISAINSLVKVSFADQSSLEKTIRRKEAGSLFLHIVAPTDEELQPGRCYKILMDVEGNLYYFAYHSISEKLPAGMTAVDWKALSGYVK